MTIAKDNTRLMITLPKDIAEYIKERAAKEDRSLSNMVAFLLKKQIEEELDQ